MMSSEVVMTSPEVVTLPPEVMMPSPDEVMTSLEVMLTGRLGSGKSIGQFPGHIRSALSEGEHLLRILPTHFR